ncbi:xylose isomerase [Chitinophaga alhagiae]|uniref:Xylose isomerase n=1 Tax=Chitinophaga alhagiae TaxID=2203219 RepID=A0ABM6WB25_9BACT|nr:twin-arginine translocation signal domain-containing protein [Chitinophaga alhagiae]AWO01139.1 xylose isomerase [Chitinophaga alhagiae]
MQLNRRNFLKQSAAAGATSLLPSLPAFSTAPGEQQTPAAAGFRLVVLATNWGFQGSTDEFCRRAKEVGYDGIEMWWPGDAAAQDALFAALAKYQLEIGFLCGSGSSDYAKHAEQFEAALKAATGQQRQRPLYINCHSGRDHFSFEQNTKLIEITTRISQQSGIPVCHETHRSRMMFAAHITRRFIETQPALRLTLDISHWCNVHESLLQDQQETVAMALSRAEHVHARIGHPEGPQVNDPRAPEWEGAVKAHFAWWDEIARRKREKGEVMTVLTEFGPVDYMPALPYTRQAVANQWDINVHMMKLLKARYGK